MASNADTQNRKAGSDESQAAFNENMANEQRNKNVFRAHKVSSNADPFNPSRLDNAIQQKLLDT